MLRAGCHRSGTLLARRGEGVGSLPTISLEGRGPGRNTVRLYTASCWRRARFSYVYLPNFANSRTDDAAVRANIVGIAVLVNFRDTYMPSIKSGMQVEV
jgi:hypothetical protein